MDAMVERLVRLITLARSRGDVATELMLMARLQTLARPGQTAQFTRSFDRALAIVRWW